MTVSENVAFGLHVKRVSRAKCARASPRRCARCASRGSDERRPRAALRRPAAARRPRPRARQQARRAAAGRAARRPRPQAAQGDAARAQGDPAPAPRTTFVYVTHDQEEALTMSRPHRRHERRQRSSRSRRRASSTSVRRRPSSPASSAPPTCSHCASTVRDAGLARMNLGEGERHARAPDGAPLATRCSITVRPEKISSAAGSRTRAARVARHGRRGRLPRLDDSAHRRLQTGERLVVHALNDELDGDEVQAVGDRIVLHWAARAQLRHRRRSRPRLQ